MTNRNKSTKEKKKLNLTEQQNQKSKMIFQNTVENIFKRIKTEEELQSHLNAYEEILLSVQELVKVDDSLGRDLLRVSGHSKKLTDFAIKHGIPGGNANAMIGAVAKAFFLNSLLPDLNVLERMGKEAINNTSSSSISNPPQKIGDMDLSDEEYENRYADRIPYRGNKF